MTVAISQELLSGAEKLAAEGGYASVTEYLESLLEGAIAAAELKESIAQMGAGLGRPAKEVFVDLAAKYGVELENCCHVTALQSSKTALPDGSLRSLVRPPPRGER